MDDASTKDLNHKNVPQFKSYTNTIRFVLFFNEIVEQYSLLSKREIESGSTILSDEWMEGLSKLLQNFR